MAANKNTPRKLERQTSEGRLSPKNPATGQPITNDGACDHLPGLYLPSLPLSATSGEYIDLSKLPNRVVVYCYPKTGRPGIEMPTGWETIPGAVGCTPQSCAFRDHHIFLQSFCCQVFGLSTQTTAYQLEAVKRLQLPFDLLSDEDLVFSSLLKLPTFKIQGGIYIKRLTFIANGGRIEKVLYPISQPDKNAEEVIEWLSTHSK